MRALGAAAAAALVLAGCETAFVGRAPAGSYALAEVNGQPLPYVLGGGTACPVEIAGGTFTLDALARRFEMAVERSGRCPGAGDMALRGSYLRRSGELTLETADGRTIVAGASSGTIALEHQGLRLRFRQPRR